MPLQTNTDSDNEKMDNSDKAKEKIKIGVSNSEANAPNECFISPKLMSTSAPKNQK